MKWLRLYHDTITDPKWRLVAIDSGQPLSAVLAVWMSMLVNASEAKERGALEGWDDRIAGAAIDLRGDAVRAIREAMQGIVLDGDKLTGWDKRQRASDNVAERVKKHRSGSDPKPPGNGAGRKGNGTVALHGGDVTLHSASETEKPLRAQSEITESKKETEEVTSECEASPPAHVPAREVDTHAGASPGFVKTANIVPFTPPGGRQAMPAGWLLPDEWREWALKAGLSTPDLSALKFRDHWRDKGAVKDEAGWWSAWEWWVGKDIEWERNHGQQRHSGRQRQKPVSGLAAYALAEMRRGAGDAEGDQDDRGRGFVRG